MNRCKDCAGLVYGDDTQCAGCRNHEWVEQAKQKQMIADANQVLREVHALQMRKRKMVMSLLCNVFIFAVCVVLFIALIDATKVAVNYELRKPEILRQHGVK